MAYKRCIYDRNIECDDCQKCNADIKRTAKIPNKNVKANNE